VTVCGEYLSTELTGAIEAAVADLRVGPGTPAVFCFNTV
jgi:hypothetical protein